MGLVLLQLIAFAKDTTARLAPLDAAALRFFQSLKLCFENENGGTKRLVSGHDIERWLLKTLKALASSGNLAKGQVKLTGDFSSNIKVVDMIDNPRAWPNHMGLYCAMRSGDVTYNFNRLQLVPYMNKKDELVGLIVNIMGLEFLLSLDTSETHQHFNALSAVYRPAQIAVDFPNQRNWIAISWEDGTPPPQTLSLKFLSHLVP